KEESTERNRIFRIIQQACRNPRILSEPCHTIAEGAIGMEYGSKYKKAFQEAMKSPEYWFEDVQFSFLDSLKISKKKLQELIQSRPYSEKPGGAQNRGNHRSGVPICPLRGAGAHVRHAEMTG
ncbi:MAG TPA: hypothetical protein PLA80_13525, partial [Synergistaceae bacterium]|nr:hypothetical protein [Synergistaceae bacterium]